MTASLRFAAFGLLVSAVPLFAGPTREVRPGAREIAAGLAALGPRADPAARNRAAAFLADAMKQAGLKEVRAVPADGFLNVEGVLPGEVSEEIVLSAHYDSVPGSAGAGDNASGCGVAIAAAADLSRTPLRHTMRVVLFDGEEAGLEGSESWLRSQGPEASRHILAALNLEMLGWAGSAGPVIDLFPVRALDGGDRLLPPAWLVYAVQRSGAAVAWPYEVADNRFPLFAQLLLRAVDVRFGADADSLLRRRIPAVTLSDSSLFDIDPAYHRPVDTGARLDTRRLERWTQATAAAVRRLDVLAGPPLFEDQYLAVFGQIWVRRDLIWIGFLLWVLLVLRGRPGRWRGTPTEERQRQMGTYLPGFLFRGLMLLAILLAPVFAILLWPASLLSLAPPRALVWRAVWIFLGCLPLLLFFTGLGVAVAQGIVRTRAGFQGGAAPAVLIPLALVAFGMATGKARSSSGMR